MLYSPHPFTLFYAPICTCIIFFDGSGGSEAVICRGRCRGTAGCSREDGGGHRLQLLERGAEIQGDQDDSPWLPLCVLQVGQVAVFISRRIIAVLHT